MSSNSPSQQSPNQVPGDEGAVSRTRRGVILGALIASLVAAYGTLTAFALRFVFPARPGRRGQRSFVGFARDIEVGQSRSLTLPSGDQLIVSNTGRINKDTGISYIGFSNRCPHLGCRVQWEQKKQEFLCPCHQGIFNSDGAATAEPTATTTKALSSPRAVTSN